MNRIPSNCPRCGNQPQWREEVHAFTTGIPLGRFVRFRLFSIRGLFAMRLKKSLGFYDVTYRCGKCGYRNKYPLHR